jgi:hypothetical protein
VQQSSDTPLATVTLNASAHLLDDDLDGLFDGRGTVAEGRRSKRCGQIVVICHSHAFGFDNDNARPAYDPKMMVALLLYAYATGTRSFSGRVSDNGTTANRWEGPESRTSTISTTKRAR